ALKEGGRNLTGSARAQRWTGGLMIGQLALTLVLMTAAGLMLRSFLAHYRTHLVIDPSPLVTARLTLPAAGYATAERRQAFFDRLTEQLRRHRPVPSATVATDGPFPFGSAAR